MKQFINSVLQFPHNYRMITADTFKKAGKIGILAVLMALLLTQLYAANSLIQAQTAVLLSPADVSSHLLLSQEYLAAGNLLAVERELALADILTTNYQLLTTNKVLGTTLSPLLIWGKIKDEPKQIQAEISFWEKIVEEKPGYRDAYLQLAIASYKIYQTEKAKEYLQKAKEIDPNYKKTKELEKRILK